MEGKPIDNNSLNLSNLPSELIAAIIERISEKDQLVNVRLVSKQLFNLTTIPHYNLGLILPNEMEELVHVFGQHPHPIGLSFNKTQKLTTEDMKHLTALTQLTALRATMLEDSTLLQLTNLVSLDMQKISFSVIQSLSKLTRLRAAELSRSDSEGKVAITLNRLASLDLTNEHKTWPNLTCPNLTSLHVVSQQVIPPDWLAQLTCLSRELQMKHEARRGNLSQRLTPDVCAHLTSLKLHRVYIENDREIQWQGLKELSLNTLQQDRVMVALRHMSQCTSLTSLNLTISATNQQGLVDAIEASNLKALQSFTLLLGGGRPFCTVKNLLPQLVHLTRLNVNIWEDHSACIAEVGKLTNLDSLQLWIQPSSREVDDIDVSPLMAMTRLTSLCLQLNKCYGTENLTNLVNLIGMKIRNDDDKKFVDTSVNLSSLSNLTKLELTRVAQRLNIGGLTRLQHLLFELHQKNASESALEFVPEEMACLKIISLDSLTNPIPWTDLAKCTALECIESDAFDGNEPTDPLQNLRRLTRLANHRMFFHGPVCAHFSVNNLTHLTRLQSLDVVSEAEDLPQALLEQSLPRLIQFLHQTCDHCGKKGTVSVVKFLP